MAKRKRHILDAGVCREIVRELIGEQGPLTVSELYYRIKKVFRVNHAYMVTTLINKEGGFTIANGRVYTNLDFAMSRKSKPVQSVGRKKK